jgi:hypothetical protein
MRNEYGQFPKAVCADGTTLSVQASSFHGCLPKDDTGPYTYFEIGFPSSSTEELEKYNDIAGKPCTDTVYNYVPLDVLNRFTALHGGVRVDLAWWQNQENSLKG